MVRTILQYPALSSAFTAMPAGKRRIDMIVLHATAGTKAGDLFTLMGRDRTHLVSVHYYVSKLGEIYQLVQDKDIAWHAGVSYWEGENDCNRFSLGIELENLNNGLDSYPQAQQDALVWLCQTKVQQYNIPRSRLVRHIDIAPHRKTDPRGFPWDSFKNAVYQGVPDVPPPPPPPPPSPDVQLRDTLLDWSYRQVRHVYHPDWAMHQFAIRERLGPPLSPPFGFRANGQAWVAELYGVDAICSSTNDWQTILRLSEVTDEGLKTAFRTAAWGEHGVQYHPDWAQHQFADQKQLGLPLSENVRLTLPDGRAFGTQIFSLDTMYSPDGMWETVDLLSTLANTETNASPDPALRDALANQAYQRVGTSYHPDWAMHQYAQANGLGSALTNQAVLKIGTHEYVAIPFGRAVIFSPFGDWGIVRRLDELFDAKLSAFGTGHA